MNKMDLSAIVGPLIIDIGAKSEPNSNLNVNDAICLNGNNITRDQAQDLIDVLQDWIKPDTSDDSDYQVEQAAIEYTENLQIDRCMDGLDLHDAFKAGAEWAKKIYSR